MLTECSFRGHTLGAKSVQIFSAVLPDVCLDFTYISARQSSRFSPVVNWCGCIKGQRRWFPSAEDTADVPFMPCPFDLQKRRKPSGSQQGTDGQRLCWGTAEFQNIYVRLLKRNGHMPKAPESSQFGFCNQHATGWGLGSAHNLTWDTSTCRGLASACSLLCSVLFLHRDWYFSCYLFSTFVFCLIIFHYRPQGS